MTELRREQCTRCKVVMAVDQRGRVVQHDRQDGWSWVSRASDVTTIPCPGSRKPSIAEKARRHADHMLARHRRIAESRDEVLVALDAYQEGRPQFSDRIPEWCRLALWQYRDRWSVPAVHPFRYETKVAPNNRRAETRGDIYCRFCGGRMITGVKRPAETVAASEHARRHLTICALQVLAGMRESVAPTFKALPLEDLMVSLTPRSSGPLFEGGSK